MNDTSPSVNTQQQQSRREFLKAAALGAAATGFLPMLVKAQAAPVSDGTEFTLFYQPTKLRNRAERFSAWSHSIAVRDGKLFNAVSVQQFGPNFAHKGPLGLAIAESDDGVHWRETDAFACPLERGLAGYCLRWTGREFVYFSTERNQGTDRNEYPVVVRQYRSRDLKTWEFMGDEFTTRPDNRWYRCRWDELVILEDDGKFYGYIVPSRQGGVPTLRQHHARHQLAGQDAHSMRSHPSAPPLST